jgi:hypothetical protein
MLIFFLILSTQLSADVFRIAGQFVDFVSDEGLLIANCKEKCIAKETVLKHNKIELKKIRKGMKFVNSIGSDVCSRVYKAHSVIGLAGSGDQRAFCLFADSSMIEVNSLTNYLHRKKIVQ